MNWLSVLNKYYSVNCDNDMLSTAFTIILPSFNYMIICSIYYIHKLWFTIGLGFN